MSDDVKDLSKRIGKRDADSGGLIWPEQDGLGHELPNDRRAVTTVWPDPDHFYVLPPGVAVSPDADALTAAATGKSLKSVTDAKKKEQALAEQPPPQPEKPTTVASPPPIVPQQEKPPTGTGVDKIP